MIPLITVQKNGAEYMVRVSARNGFPTEYCDASPEEALGRAVLDLYRDESQREALMQFWLRLEV